VQFANGAVESGGNVGSDFGIYRYGDSGAFLDNAATSLIITRSTGNAIFGYNLEARGTIVAHNDVVTSRADGVSGVLYFGTYASPRYFYCDGSQFFLVGGTTFNVQSSMAVTGNLNVTGNLALNGTITSGNEIAVSKAGAENSGISFVNSLRNWYTFCASDGHYWIYDQNGTRNYLNIDPTAGIVSIGGILDTGGYTISTNGTKCRAGLNGAQSNIYNIFWTGSSTQIWIDSSNQGTITVSSDYRIKKDVLDLPGTWETVKALRPIKYTLKDFTPPAEVKARAKQAAEDRQKGVEKPAPGPLIVGDDIERWGFIAHELQATLIADAATGEKDSPDTIQSPNPWTMIAALTKALQEAMARIEALEAAQATP
jgi:hypothetical protein